MIIQPAKSVRLSPPAVILDNPKFPVNLSNVLRTCSCFDISTLVFTKERLKIEIDQLPRLPREERMRGYGSVTVYNTDYPMEMFVSGTPVVIELTPNSEPLTSLTEFPIDPIFIFGPEDGSVSTGLRTKAHRFMQIPSRHCFNLNVAVSITLAFWRDYMFRLGDMPLSLSEQPKLVEPEFIR